LVFVWPFFIFEDLAFFETAMAILNQNVDLSKSTKHTVGLDLQEVSHAEKARRKNEL